MRGKQFALLLHCTGSAAFSATPSQEAEVVRLLETSGLQFTVVLSYSRPYGFTQWLPPGGSLPFRARFPTVVLRVMKQPTLL